jgi:nitroreductase
VEREKLLLCLEAARLAPSACNAQPWHFLVVDDPALKEKLADHAFSGLFAMKFAREAPVIVALVANQHSLPSRAGGAVRRVDFSLLDLGIAGEHFVLQAAELGLGTCWIGWFDERAARKILEVPRGKRIAYLISLGYPAEPAAVALHRRKPILQMSSFNRWDDSLK